LQSQPDILNSFKIFRATGKPAFLIAHFLHKYNHQVIAQLNQFMAQLS
jgi:hypothetical protein